MKSFIFQILFLFLFSTCLLAQNNQGNFRSAIDSTEDAFMSNWQESSNLSDKLTVVVEYDFPTEFGFYLGQSKLEYKSIMLFAGVDVRYDNGNWITLLSGVGGTTGEFIPPWNTLGTHTMDIRYWDLAGNLHFINNIVYVIPPRDKIYYDGLGNWVSGWTGTTASIDRPVIIIEGFDPLNLTWPDYYYGKAANWFNRIRGLDADVLIFNFNEGGTDLVANAHIIQEFARYIESITEGSEKIILAGLSMGGPIGRYALAEAEAQGIPLYVSHFLSIDGPQQDAIMPRDFLDYIKDHDEGEPHPELNSVAAKQMLRYDPYDPYSPGNNSMHKIFYNVLNNLNGDGYPHNCINIGVSFAPNITNPNLGEWLEVEIDLLANQHFYLWEENECLVPGSYLPLSATRSSGSVWYGYNVHWNLVRKKNPTYIPYVSALDIVNGESKFDITLNSSAIHYHVEFPDDLVDPVSNAIGLLEDSYNNVTFKNVIDNIQEDNADGLLKVTDYSGAQTQVSSGGTVSVSTNQDNIVETLDRYRLNFSGSGINYQQNNWNKELSEYKVKHTFKGWHNDIQKAYFSKLDKVIVKNSLEGTGLSIGNVDFKDPWYKIGESQPNEFQTFSSPFTPGDGTYASYGGVFLNQNPTFDPTLPVYSVKVNLTQDITLYNTGKESGRSHKFYFRNWSYDANKISLQTPGSNETAVVFKTSDAVLSANLKGTNLSEDQKAYNTTSQRKIVKIPDLDGTLHSVYSSNNRVWYEMSTDNGATWSLLNNGQPLDEGQGKLPSIDYVQMLTNHTPPLDCWVTIIVYQEKYGSGFKIKAKSFLRIDDGPYIYRNFKELASYSTESYSNNANPVLAIDNAGYITFVWERKSSPAGLYCRRGTITVNTQFINNILGLYDTYNSKKLDNINYSTSASSINPSITVSKTVYPGPNGSGRHLAWQDYNEIKYATIAVTNQQEGITLGTIETPSYASGYPSNYLPSLSLANGKPVVSWTGYNDGNIWKITGEQEDLIRKRALVKVRGDLGWGSLTELGDNVNFVNNNSVTSVAEKTVFIWSQGTSPQSKWIRRDGSSSSNPFSNIGNLSHSGIENQLTSGSDFNNMYAMVFNKQSVPYYFIKSTTNFSQDPIGGGIEKIGTLEQISYGRSGIINKQGVEFVFNTGDVFVADSSIQFTFVPDTLLFNSEEELNTAARTENFWLEEGVDFFFSNLYYVIRQELADSVLTEQDQVNFKVELVRAQSGEVIGTFDNITYNKNNLEKYANINYQVNCSGIQAGEYFLRIVTTVSGNAEYNLSNIQRDEFDLSKLNYVNVSFTGEGLPVSYDLSQNYPNPFNPTTTIRYHLPKDGIATLKVYDILGAEVATLVNEEKIAGRYEVSFDASRLASGVYIYRLNVNDFVNVKKMVLLK